VIRGFLPLFDGPCGHRGGFDLFCDLIGLFRLKIHWNFDTIGFDEYPHHAQIGWSDLHIRFDVALVVDTHDDPFEILILVLPCALLDWQEGAGDDVPWRLYYVLLMRPKPIGWQNMQWETTRPASIFCVRGDPSTAKLRMFYVVADGRGSGVAQALLDGVINATV
jgi:GNAT superfamily N-acetyltransferase